MDMQVRCSHCGARFTVSDEQVLGHSWVQFRCSKCNQTTVLSPVGKQEHTQVATPLLEPSAGAPGEADIAATIVSSSQGLALPRDKAITLSVISGPSKGLKHPVTRPRVIIGRKGGGADLEINDPEVSRGHCAVEVRHNDVRLLDLNSTNGTYVNEERVHTAELQHLSEFRVASSLFLVTILPKQE